MLVQVDPRSNRNKFYEVTLEGDVVTKRWGRVGAGDGGQRMVESTGRAGYEKAIASKIKRGYSKVDLVDGDPGENVTRSELATVARRKIPATKKADPVLDDLLEQWCAANRHAIETTSGGRITVDTSGVVSTALGVVSARTIAEARTVLDRIAADPTNERSIGRYLELVPQDLGRRGGWADVFQDRSMVANQGDFLDQLASSVSLATATDASEVDAEFRYRLKRQGPRSAAFAEVRERYLRSRNAKHQSYGLALAEVYEIVPTDKAEVARWQELADRHGNVRRLWHGTADPNLVSILHRGLVVPPARGSGTFHVTGRMFGDGVYLSDQSSKSLNYATGFWRGASSTRPSMLLADVVMGHELRPTSRTGLESKMASGRYQSISVRGGTCGVVNNEMVVRDTAQIRLRYLCVFS
jgi:poly [ADP-ribose] polymerase